MSNIFLIGFMGTGKSAIASYLARNYGMNIIEMDETIEQREGTTINSIFKTKGEEYFRDYETNLLKEICREDNYVVSCGGGTPMREENVKLMREHGTVVLLNATPETIYGRVCHSHNRPLLNDNMSVEHIAELLSVRRPKYQAAADIVIDTDNKTKKAISDEIIHRIAK